jgi:hypothetical protein
MVNDARLRRIGAGSFVSSPARKWGAALFACMGLLAVAALAASGGPARAQGACGQALLLGSGPPRSIAEANRREEARIACERERNAAALGRQGAQARVAARGKWDEAPPAFRACLEQQLARFETSMERLIQQDVFLGDPYLAELEAYCLSR